MELAHFEETAECLQVVDALARVGDKWSVLVVMQLEPGAKRYNVLKREIAQISPKMLASTLRALEREGYVSRSVRPTKPPSVDYALTDLGRELLVPVRAVASWVLQNAERIEAARAAYDQRSAEE